MDDEEIAKTDAATCLADAIKKMLWGVSLAGHLGDVADAITPLADMMGVDHWETMEGLQERLESKGWELLDAEPKPSPLSMDKVGCGDLLAIGRLDRPLKIDDRVKTLSGEIHHLVHYHGDDIATGNYFYRWDRYSYTIEHAAMADGDEITHILIS